MSCLCIVLLLLPVGAGAGDRATQIRATVVASDCSKCHEDVVFSLKTKGKAHQPLCLDCHQGHPPADVDVIPACDRCHFDAEHYRLTGCLQCHTDPHAPLEIKLSHDITTACLSCHQEQIEQLRSFPSIHTKLACTACHNYHGQIQPCHNCHLPHSDTMGRDSCNLCHKAHMPLVVNYGDTIVSEDCGSCHVDVYQGMVTNTSRHRDVACIACHTGKHGIIPACEKCHDQPHPDAMMAKFSHCSECHGSAHDLTATKAGTSVFVKGRESD